MSGLPSSAQLEITMLCGNKQLYCKHRWRAYLRQTAQKKIERKGGGGEQGTLASFICNEHNELLKDGNKKSFYHPPGNEEVHSISPGQSLQSPWSLTQHPLGAAGFWCWPGLGAVPQLSLRSSPGSGVSRPAAAKASPGKLFKMQIISPYPRLTESEILIGSLFQQALQGTLCMRAQMEKALLRAKAGGSGRLVLPVHYSKGHVSPSELHMALVIDWSVSFKIHLLESNPQDLRIGLYLEMGPLTR